MDAQTRAGAQPREASRANGNGNSFLYERRAPELLKRIFCSRALLCEEARRERGFSAALEEALRITEESRDASLSIGEKVRHAAAALVERVGFEGCAITVGGNGSSVECAYRRGEGAVGAGEIDGLRIEMRGKNGEGKLGEIVVEGSNGSRFSEEAQRLLERFAAQFSITLHNSARREGLSGQVARLRQQESLLRGSIEAAMGIGEVPKEFENADQVTRKAYRFLNVARDAFNGRKGYIEGLFVFTVDRKERQLTTVLGIDISNRLLVRAGTRWVGLGESGILPNAVRNAEARKSNMIIGVWNRGERNDYEFDASGACIRIGGEMCRAPGFINTLAIPKGEEDGLVVIYFVYVDERGSAENVFAFYMRDGKADGTTVRKNGEVVVGREQFFDLLNACRFGGKSVADAIALEEIGVDGLTGLLTHNRIIEELDGSIARWQRSAGDEPPVVVMADIDDFKKVNDAHGHLAGDEVLREVARRMAGAVRDVDRVGRYGGEEFMAVLYNTKNPLLAAERIRAAVCAEPIVVDLPSGRLELNVTVSVGLARFEPDEARGREKLVEWADKALYEAKRAGKNGVAFYSKNHGATLLGEDEGGMGLAAGVFALDLLNGEPDSLFR